MRILAALAVLTCGWAAMAGDRPGEIAIETERFVLRIGEDACARSLVVKATGEECLDASLRVPLFESVQERPFNNENKLAYLNRRTVYRANRLKRKGERLVVGFDVTPYEAVVKCEATDGAVVFELEDFISNTTDEHQYGGLTMDVPPVASFRILQLPVARRANFGHWLNVSWDEQAAVALIAADPKCEVRDEERNGVRILSADLMRGYKLRGGRAAIVAGAGPADFLEAMDRTEKALGLPLGVESRRNPLLKASTYWTFECTPKTVDQHIAMARKGGFKLMLLYYPSIVKYDDYRLLGDYDWRDEYPNGEADLRAMLAKIKAAGITPGLHTLQTHIGLRSRYVTPVADPRLNKTRAFTLAKALSAGEEDGGVDVCENPIDAPMREGCRILQFGGELLSYERYTVEPPYRFLGVKRGVFGTRVAAHERGTGGGVLDVSEYGARSCYIDQKTDLQDEIGRKIARLCDAGMEFCYFDGSEGVNPPCGINVALAQLRVVNKFRKMPLFTVGAAKSHYGWHLLSGGNAFDTFPPEKFKEKIVEYPMAEASVMRQDFTRIDFGWWGTWCPGDRIGPDRRKTIGAQPDMWEWGTSRAAAWDCPITVVCDMSQLSRHPRADDLFEVVRRWEDVRTKEWLTAAQKEALKSPTQEHHLYRNERGGYELHEIEMLPAPEGAKEVRAFLFEREGKRVIAYWHAFGCGTLEVALGKDGRKTAVPADWIRYLTTDLTREEAKIAWQMANLLVAAPDGLHGRVTASERISTANACGDETRRTWRGTAWRNERVHMPFVVWGDPAHPLRSQASALVGPNGAELPLEVRWVGEVIADDRPHGAAVDPARYPEYLVGDVLESSLDFRLTKAGYRAVWAKVRTSADTRPGVYRGKLEVTDTVTSSSVSFDIELKVLSAALPAKKAFHLDIWQTPWTLSRYYKVKPFSPAHFERMEPFLRELADAGQKVITTTITDYPWNIRTNIDSARSMVRYVKKTDGSFVADFAVMDRYVAFAESCGIGPEIHCYAPVKFEGGKDYYYIDEKTGEEKTLSLTPGTSDYEAYWGPLLTQLEAHAVAKGWTGRLYIALDEKSPAETAGTVDLIAKYAPSAKLHMSGNSSPDKFSGIRIDGFSQQLGTSEMTATFLSSLAKRREQGLYTTFYTCCVPFRPNALPMSPLWEQRWLGFYVAAKGFDGYLKSTFFRWPVNADPLVDTHCYPGFPCGDSFLIYPGPRLSLRWESLVDGIEDAEKIRVLREAGALTSALEAALRDVDMKSFSSGTAQGPDKAVACALAALEDASCLYSDKR